MSNNMFDKIEQARLNELHIKFDPDTQLKAFIAIHNTRLGPAIGGCRCIPYSDEAAAIEDAIRLAKGMSYKAALAQLPYGGGKSVLMCPKHIADRQAYFERFGEFVASLGGRYITSVDCGTGIDDMDAIARATDCVVGTHQDGCEPSPMTALGVLKGIEAAVNFKLNKPNLNDVHIALQGVGHVGMALAELLAQKGARLSIADINQQALKTCQTRFDAKIVSPDEIASLECDVFSPCGLGGTLNKDSLKQLHCKIIAGSANNQLADESLGRILHNKDILYAPDFIINAGGLIQVALYKLGRNAVEVKQKTLTIGHTLTTVFERSYSENKPCNEIANTMAEEILYAPVSNESFDEKNYRQAI